MSTKIRNPLHPHHLGSIPREIIGRILTTLGSRYLLDSSSADAYIRGVGVGAGNLRGQSHGILRVRVTPRAKGRRAFVLQKKFVRWHGGTGRSGPWIQGRSEALPIHVEYAMYKAPLLWALLVSGMVARGDTVDLPVPHPQAWGMVVEWLYTGRWAEVREVRENVEYLGGRV